MDVMNCYVAIKDMIRHMISSQHLHVPTQSRYMYSPTLLEYLHQVPQVAVVVEEYDFGTRGKRGEETEDNEKWNTVEKERKDRDSRSMARARIKQRLTTIDPPKNYSTFDSDNEEEEEIEETQDKIVEDKIITDTFEVEDTIEAKVMLLDVEEDVISRLEVQELEYMQEQEETKSAVLGKDKTMEEMMERKLTERFEWMDAEWEHKASNEAIKIAEQAETITRQADRIFQLESSVCEKAAEVQEQAKQVTNTIETLKTTLTIATDRINEVDQATEGMANFLDAAKAHQMESMKEANGIAASIERAKQRLIDTQTRLQTNIKPTTLDIKDAKEATHREGKLVSGDIRKERDRILKTIADKDHSSRDELQRRTDRSIDRITAIGNDTMDNMDIKAATALDRAESTVNAVINGTVFQAILQQRIDAYSELYPPTMQDTMYGFTKTYLKNNEQLDEYIKDIAGSTVGTDQLNKEVHRAAANWMDNNMREDNQASYEASDGDKSRDDGEEEDIKTSALDYNGERYLSSIINCVIFRL
jgi:hypothetical protein